MKDKVSELRQILNQKKAMDSKNQTQEEPQNEETQTPESSGTTEEENAAEGEDTQQVMLQKIEALQKANATQKDMFLRQAAEFENMKKRLQKEQDDFKKFAYEKLVEELLPAIDNLEMTLTHIQDESDPIASGVILTVKQMLQSLEKHGVMQISGEGEDFDPNLQEAIGTEAVEGMESGKVTKVHRKGYSLHGKLLRAAMVTVSA